MKLAASSLALALAAGLAAPVAAQVYSASGLPILIPPGQPTSTTGTNTNVLTISGGTAAPTSLKLVLRLNHTYIGDIDAVLIRGSRYLHLTSDNGGTSENFANVRFDDSSPILITSIGTNSNNVTGTFRQEGGSLSVRAAASPQLTGLTPVATFAALIAGETTADGNWTLWIDDDGSNDFGSLQYWSLEFNGAVDPTGPAGAPPPPPSFSGSFSGTPNSITLDAPPVAGTTVWTGPTGAQPGITDGAGETTPGTTYATSTFNLTGNEVGYSFTHAGGPVNFILDSVSSSPILFLLNSTGTPAGALADTADFFGSGAQVLEGGNLAAGTYFLAVDSASASGFAYSLSAVTPPANDNCSNATTVLAGGSYPFDTTTAARDAQGGCFFTLESPDVWFVYNPTQAGYVTFSSCNADFEISLQAFASCTDTTPLACSIGGCNEAGARVCVTPGVPVYCRVAGVFDAPGTGTLNVTFTPGGSTYTAPSGTPEGEACAAVSGDAFNGGCDAFTPAFTALTLGTPVIGQTAYDGSDADFDWYSFTLPSASNLVISGQAQGPAIVTLYEVVDACNDFSPIATVANIPTCEPSFSINASVAAGTYYITVTTPQEAINDCGSGSNQYWLLASTAVACVADFDDGSGTGTPDGGVGIEDLLYYLTVFEAGTVAADVDDGSGTGTPDGGVGIEDLLYYLTRFEAGC